MYTPSIVGLNRRRAGHTARPVAQSRWSCRQRCHSLALRAGEPRGEVTSLLLFSAILNVFSGCGSDAAVSQELSPGVAIQQERMDDHHDELVALVSSAAQNVMSQPGLVAALGGARIKVLKAGSHEITLPLPQLTEAQAPICYYIRSTPREVAAKYRLQRRGGANDIVNVRWEGAGNQEVQFDWSAVILVAGKTVSPNQTNPDTYRLSSACVQADSDEIRKLAGQLWPPDGQLGAYAANIQRFIREMKPAKQPRSLDALGILDSGANGICTANANLALALLRTKGIASRSVAVIPSISQRLEMHRIVECFHNGQWISFDPSSLHADVPMKPWQSVIMAKTTKADEELAMKPRMGAMRGCPYGQELELVSAGVTLWGQDFFWTMAQPLAEFQLDADAIALATAAWKRYLQNGALSPGQIKARLATDSRQLRESLELQ